MKEYITLEQAAKAFSFQTIHSQGDCMRMLIDAVSKGWITPAADVAEVRRHGKWIEKEILNRRTGIAWKERRCSECGYYNHKPNFPKNYCPNCGALMKGGRA